MLTIAYYFLQVMICSGIMMLYYAFVLRNKRFHHYNRFYILATLLLSWLIPLLKIKVAAAAPETQSSLTDIMAIVANNNSYFEQTIAAKGFEINWDMVAISLFVIVSLFFTFFFVKGLLRIYHLFKTQSSKNFGEVCLIFTKAAGTPFSFFKYIFWNEDIQLQSETGKKMLQHEITHIKEKHSIDKIFMQMVLIVGWYNPFFWFAKSEMNLIHEFIADQKSVKDGDAGSLAEMLLAAAYPQQQYLFANSFFFSPIKRRLLMIANNKNPRFSYVRRLIVLPLLAIVVLLFAFRKNEITIAKEKSIKSEAETNILNQQTESANAYKELIKNEQFKNRKVPKDTMPAINDSTRVYITGITYTDKNKKTERRVDTTMRITVRGYNVNDSLRKMKVLYVVDGVKQDHNILKEINPADIQSISVLKDSTAIAIYGSDGKNGVVQIRMKKSQSPIYIVNGVKYDNNVLKNVNPADIKSINVLKDSMAIAKYGNEGKNGALEITTNGEYIAVKDVQLKYIKSGKKIFTAVDTKPVYPGGSSEWEKYLTTNINIEKLKAKGAPPGKYTVTFSFIIQDDGVLNNVSIFSDPGYGIGSEAIRLIRFAPKWIPAKQNGINVNYLKKETITIVIPEK